jgi:hypothetical protein
MRQADPMKTFADKKSMTKPDLSLNNYSKHYLVDKDTDFINYTFSGSTTTLGKKRWSDFGNESPSTSSSNIFTRDYDWWKIDGDEIEMIIEWSNSKSDIQLTVNATNIKKTAQLSIDDCKFIYDNKSILLIKKLSSSSSAEHPTAQNENERHGQIMKIPDGFSPEEYTVATSDVYKDFNGTVYDHFSESHNPKALILYDGKFCSSKYLYEKEIATYNALQSEKDKYKVSGSFNKKDVTTYSWSVFKFVRKNTFSSSMSINWFALCFNDNTNITGSDLDNGDALICVQIKRDTDIVQTYKSSAGDINSGASNSYNWIRYKPGNNSSDQAVLSAAGPVKWNEGYGANALTSAYDNTANKGGATKPNFTSTHFSNKTQILTGVFHTDGKLATGEEITFYVTVGIKNNIERYFTHIDSFDIFRNDGLISR